MNEYRYEAKVRSDTGGLASARGRRAAYSVAAVIDAELHAWPDGWVVEFIKVELIK